MLTSEKPVLDVGYGDSDAFGLDYRANLSNGGVFVETTTPLELRQLVTVRLCLEWCDRSIVLDGEVVHIVPEAMQDMGGRPGVAVQFSDPSSDVRELLAPLCVDRGPAPRPDVRRVAERKTVRTSARIETPTGELTGRTRNLSRSGVLIGVESAGDVAVGDGVRVVLQHPSGAEELAVGGVVVRAIEIGERIDAVAVHFDVEDAELENVGRFVEAVQGAEHARRLGGISGPFSDLGPESVVQMLATTAPRGTIVLRSGEEEGILSFESGLVRIVRVGAATGMKALIRILSWRDGTFEFHNTLEASQGEAPFPLDAALFDAVRQLDESQRLDTSGFPLQARLVARPDASGSLPEVSSKVEAALLDLAGAGFTVQRALEVIPEPDPDIFRALQQLMDEGVIELH